MKSNFLQEMSIMKWDGTKVRVIPGNIYNSEVVLNNVGMNGDERKS